MRQLYYWDKATQRMVEHRPTSTGSSIHIIDDTMPATKHPKDGKVYDSKSAFRDVTRAFGCQEVGNDYSGKPDSFFTPQPKDTREETRRILHKIISGELPVPRFPRTPEI